MILAIRKNIPYIVAILVLALIGVGTAAYILVQQGVRLPFVTEAPVRITATLDTAQAITPGQGQTVQVAGVQVGKIADVKLVDGQAQLALDIEPKWIRDGLIKTDATALLRPRTPLKDMYLQVFPGDRKRGKPIAKGFNLPLSNTLTDVNLDQILAALDGRTRDYLKLLLNGAATGLKGRGGDLAEVFKRFEPTVQDLGLVNRAVAGERVALRHLITTTGRLNGELAKRPDQISRLVTTANQTFGAFASEDQNLRATVTELPPTLKQATQTLQDVRPLANELGPATRALTPTVQALDRSNKRVQPAARKLTPIIRTQVRPFIRASRPLIRDLVPTAQSLSVVSPELRRSAKVLNNFFNMLSYNKNGREAPGQTGRDEGYLFWLAWTTHQGANLINVDDANGPYRSILLSGLCSSLISLVNATPQVEFSMGLSPLLATACGNPSTTSTDLQKVFALLNPVLGGAAAGTPLAPLVPPLKGSKP
jgi:phospholipid/cholesterol/gamma-HCH transport system substrate-binding protein